MNDLIILDEPKLAFGYGQVIEDPRDGLTLFGPLDEGKPHGIRWGVVGTRAGISRIRAWIEKLEGLISNKPPDDARPPFPGFEAAFGIPWRSEAEIEKVISIDVLRGSLYLDDKHQRVYQTVGIFTDPIVDAIRNEEAAPDIWFIVIPDEVYKYCRPKSVVEEELRLKSEYRLSRRKVQELLKDGSLFAEEREDAVPYEFEVHFHNQLKARILERHVPTQIVRESTIAHMDFLDKYGQPQRDLEVMMSAIAWNISTAAFYKTGGRPWKLAGVRDGVCYVGLVFKKDETKADPRAACCGAQMFLDSGDGLVFRGDVGPWYREGEGTYHLKRGAASELIEKALRTYVEKKGKQPAEMFIHGKVRFNNEEWAGFEDATSSGTKLVGVRIRTSNDIKLYRRGDNPVLRGTAFIQGDKIAYLWTRGFIPRLNTYPGREVPNPLLVDVCRGDANLRVVLDDIMGLTKLNYNSCQFGDGVPVTLRFADAIGEILTAGPLQDPSPLPFKFYI